MTGGALAFDYESGPPVERGRLGVWLLIVAEALFFAGLLAAWVVLRSADPAWPAEPRLALPAGLGLTALLVLASVASALAVRAARRGDQRALAGRAFAVAVLGTLFLVGVAFEVRHLAAEGIGPATDIAWGFFYLFTLAHGVHVLVGVLWTAALAWLALRRRLPAWRARRVEYAAAYQHFVDGVWIGLFVIFYLIP